MSSKKTIIDYVQRYGDVSLKEKELNEVDALVLCQLSYLKFDGLVPQISENLPSVSLRQLSEHPDADRMFADARFEIQNRALFHAMKDSVRFGGMRLNCYINQVEKEWETQFSAVTCLLEDGTLFLVFRGTDESFVGWKEDFNMAFRRPVPAQINSAKYLNIVTGRLHKSFYVGGHSKGGNLAIYSAMNCIPEISQRILKIYCMDGPGFRPEILAECDYEKVADRVVKILPRDSLVGMVFETGNRYQTIETTAKGLAAHDPYSWIVEDDHFRKADKLYNGRKFMDNTFNEWVLSLDDEKLELVIDTLYGLVNSLEADDLVELDGDKRKNRNQIISAIKDMDPEVAGKMTEIFKSLVEMAGARAMAEINKKVKRIGGRKNKAPRVRKKNGNTDH